MLEITPPVTTGQAPPVTAGGERKREREREGSLTPPPDEVAQSASSKGERNVAQHNVPVLDVCWGRQALSQGIRYGEARV